MKVPRRCLECGILIESNDPRKIYCSPACGKRARDRDPGITRNPELDDPAFFTSKKDPFEARRLRRAEEWASGRSHPDEPDYPDLPECLRRK